MKKINLLLSVLLLILFCSCNTTNTINNQNKNTELKTYALTEGMTMPNIILQTNKDDTFDLHNIDKPIVINFFATWCPPCKEEMPSLHELYKQYTDKIDFIIIDCAEKKEIVDDFINSNNFTFPVCYDEEGKYAMSFNITGIPTTYILDENKNIKNLLVGMRSKEDFEQMIQDVINE